MRRNHLLVSATRWQHWYQIGFATLFSENHKIANNSATTEAKEKINTFWNP
jgi:hypothetical protein